MTGSDQMDAERAFGRMVRARRRAALSRALRRIPRDAGGRLPVYAGVHDARRRGGARAPGPRVREIPLEAIEGTVEPSRADAFDAGFRAAPATRTRWQRVWLAEHRGEILPPISVVPVGAGYAVRDGHHRVSVARARGAVAIDAAVESR